MTQFALYKGSGGKFGACQFNLKPYEYSSDPSKGKTGVVFINAASSTAPDVYDWTNKIVMALNVTDVGKLIQFFVSAEAGSSVNLVHDPKMGTDEAGKTYKGLSIFTKEGPLNGGLITVKVKSGDTQVQHKIPISGDEVVVLKTLLETAVVRMVGWDV